MPSSAPHICPDSAHTCDNPNDLMYPYVDGPLSSAILDPGPRRLVRHSSPWFDVQDSPFLKHVQEQVHLTVDLTGGAGEVTSNPTGVECTAACGQDWDAGSEVELTAEAGKGLRFVRWSGDCSGPADCTVTLDKSKSVSAFFAPATFRLTVAVSGGRGRVVSRPGRDRLHEDLPPRLHLVSSRPADREGAQGLALPRLVGRLPRRALTCGVPMTAATSVGARFVRSGTG